MVEKKVLVNSSTGLHARPASMLCSLAQQYASKVLILYQDKVIDAKSILGVMAAGITKSTEITIRCDGADEEIALKAITELIEGME